MPMTDQTDKTMQLVGIPQLRRRWGVSAMFIERRLRNDDAFPVPLRFTKSKIRKFKLSDIEAYEKIALTRVAREARG